MIRSARYLGVAPWEIEPDMHDRQEWAAWALLCEGAELEAQYQRNKYASRRRKH